MSTEIEDRFVFTDSNGLRRYSSDFGFNAYGSAADALASARAAARRGFRGPVYVYRLPDGTFDYSSRADGRFKRNTPDTKAAADVRVWRGDGSGRLGPVGGVQ